MAMGNQKPTAVVYLHVRNCTPFSYTFQLDTDNLKTMLAYHSDFC